MKGKWYTRAISVTIALSFVLGGLVAAPAVSADVPPTADPNISKWSTQATPTEKDLVILPGSDIIDMAVGGDDGEVIYAIGVWYDQCEEDVWAGQVYGPNDIHEFQHPKLWKSVDGGVTWKDISDDVLGADNLPDLGGEPFDFTFFSNVAISPDDPDFVVVAGWGYDAAATPPYVPIVVGTDNAGSDWEYMGSADQIDGLVSALDVSPSLGGTPDVAVGTFEVAEMMVGPISLADIQMDGNAAVYLFDAGKFSSAWVEASAWGTQFAPADIVTDLKFSPNYDIDDTFVALTIGWVDPASYTVAPGSGADYRGYKVQMATTGSIKDWNADADFGSAYPMLVTHDGSIIVAPQDDDLLATPPPAGYASIVMRGEAFRRGGHLALPQDFTGYNGADRRVMVAVNGFEFNPATYAATPDLGEELSEGGYMFWLMNNKWAPEELLQHEGNPYIASIAYHGNVNMMGKTMVGLQFPQDWGYEDIAAWAVNPIINSIPVCNGVQVLRSETLDVCCPVWQAACKPPSGQFMVTVAYTPDGSMGYAVTQGESRMWTVEEVNGDWVPKSYSSSGSWSDESAFSVSGHVGAVGDAWNQSGLIDTSIDLIADVALSAGGSADPCATDTPCIYIATINAPWLFIPDPGDLTSVLEDARDAADNADLIDAIDEAIDVLGGAFDPAGLLQAIVNAIHVYYEIASPTAGDDEALVVLVNVLYELRAGKIGDCDSIWRKCDTGGWLRIWHKALGGLVLGGEEGNYPAWSGEGFVEWMVLGLAPEEKTNAETIYMADLGTPYVWFSQDSADVCCPAGLGCWSKRNTGLSSIADIAVLDASTVYALDFDAKVRKSTNNARHWSSSVDSKVDVGHHIVAWGDWVLVGGAAGKVGYSDDAGSSFSELDDIGGGEVHVAFDSYFNQNGYVYAAVARSHQGVYRTTIDSADFESMNACDELDYWGIVVSAADGNPKTSASTGGVLYASYTEHSTFTGRDDCKVSGVARILNPAAEPCCGELDWDYLFRNLWVGASFASQANNIAISGDQAGSNATIWAIDFDIYQGWWNWCGEELESSLKLTKYTDSNKGRLWKFVDVFANEGPALIGPANGAVISADDCEDCESTQFIIEWDRVCDACEYDIEFALDPGFTHKVFTTVSAAETLWKNQPLMVHEDCDEGVLGYCEPKRTFYKPADPCVPSLVVPAGTFSVNQDYYWRVRARFAETGEAYRSPWSDVRSFTIAAAGTIGLSSPANGATGVPRENVVFTWSAVSGATSYEFMLWDAAGAEVASSSQANTSYVLGQTLDYDSSYKWQVKAMKDGKVINESDMATFRTLMQPVPPPEYPEPPDTIIEFPEPPGTPAWVWVVIALAAILIIVVIVLIFRTRRV